MKTIELKKVQKEQVLQSLKRNRPNDTLKKSVGKIINEVRENGDSALFKLTKEFDGVDLTKETLTVKQEEIEEAVKQLDKGFIDALEEAKANIEQFHERQTGSSWLKTDEGQMIGQLVGPVERAGLYIPGGGYGYPSTVLMTAVPAKIAGVTDIVMVTPPGKDGSVSKYTLAAAKICGINKIFKVGGAQAIAAMAYGTESILPVDVIAGPGNAYVAEAKRQVYGDVGIDLVAGPSEVVVLADIKCDPNIIAADLVSQAEHDSDASAILITDSNVLANKVKELVSKKLKEIPRKDIAEKSLEENGLIFIVNTAEEAIETANIISPEHLVVLLEQPTRWLPKIKNAGAIFLGEDSVQSAADYSVGPNHVLPTGGGARFASPLGVATFQKYSNIVWLGKSSLEKIAGSAVTISRSEGFDGHALAVEERLNK
jgi:histidinol dehydrogenase